MSLTDYWPRIKSCESELQLVLIIALTGTLIFSFWRFSASSSNSQPITVENVPDSTQAVAPVNIKSVKSADGGAGAYVASKNGKKYYLPTCAGASRIKAENRIYFKTVQEAQAKGLTPAANCP